MSPMFGIVKKLGTCLIIFFCASFFKKGRDSRIQDVALLAFAAVAAINLGGDACIDMLVTAQDHLLLRVPCL